MVSITAAPYLKLSIVTSDSGCYDQQGDLKERAGHGNHMILLTQYPRYKC